MDEDKKRIIAAGRLQWRGQRGPVDPFLAETHDTLPLRLTLAEEELRDRALEIQDERLERLRIQTDL